MIVNADSVKPSKHLYKTRFFLHIYDMVGEWLGHEREKLDSTRTCLKLHSHYLHGDVKGLNGR